MPEAGRRAAPVRPPEAIVPAEGEFEGLVQLRQAARIDGAVAGEIVADGCVWIGENARVRARVSAREVVVAGRLEGEVRASSKVELLATAHVVAQLEAPRLVLADGSFFRGRCLTRPTEAAATPSERSESGAAADARTP
ncbi:MAG: polymer-forming cytoskeletal protein [Myxococcota bacterium]